MASTIGKPIAAATLVGAGNVMKLAGIASIGYSVMCGAGFVADMNYMQAASTGIYGLAEPVLQQASGVLDTMIAAFGSLEGLEWLEDPHEARAVRLGLSGIAALVIGTGAYATGLLVKDCLRGVKDLDVAMNENAPQTEDHSMPC